MYSCGYRTLSHVAHADPTDMVKNIKQISKKAVSQLITSAKVGLFFTVQSGNRYYNFITNGTIKNQIDIHHNNDNNTFILQELQQ